MKKSKFRRVFVILLLLAGSLTLADGGYIKLKAYAAQLLLEYSWDMALKKHRLAPPWPWADTWPVARLQVPEKGVDLIVLEGDSGPVLAFGPGRMMWSAMPGTPGNMVISGHKDTSFRFLEDLRPGDLVKLQGTEGLVFNYRVSRRDIVDVADLSLSLEAERPVLTLLTCYPFDASYGGSLRMLVRAEYVEQLPNAGRSS